MIEPNSYKNDIFYSKRTSNMNIIGISVPDWPKCEHYWNISFWLAKIWTLLEYQFLIGQNMNITGISVYDWPKYVHYWCVSFWLAKIWTQLEYHDLIGWNVNVTMLSVSDLPKYEHYQTCLLLRFRRIYYAFLQ